MRGGEMALGLGLLLVAPACTERERFAVLPDLSGPPAPPPPPPPPPPPGAPATTAPLRGFTKLATHVALGSGTPRGLAVAPAAIPTGTTLVAGDVLVADPSGNRVLRVNGTGVASVFAAEASLADSGGGSLANLGHFVAPQAVAVDTAGLVWVAVGQGTNGTGGTGNVTVLNAHGAVVLQGSTPAVLQEASFRDPVGIAWNSGAGSVDRVFVLSGANGSVQRLAVSRTALASSAATTIATGISAGGGQCLAHDAAADACVLTVTGAGLDELRRIASASTAAAGDHDALVATATGALNGVSGVTFNSAGRVVVLNRATGTLVEIGASGATIGTLVSGLAANAGRACLADPVTSRYLCTDTVTTTVRRLTVPSFTSDLLPIFAAQCGTGCHQNGSSSGGLNLNAGVARGNLVNVTASAFQVFPDVRVNPGNSASGTGGSFLCEKLRPSPRAGSQMPQGGALSQTQLRLFEGWVDFGAPNN